MPIASASLADNCAVHTVTINPFTVFDVVYAHLLVPVLGWWIRHRLDVSSAVPEARRGIGALRLGHGLAFAALTSRVIAKLPELVRKPRPNPLARPDELIGLFSFGYRRASVERTNFAPQPQGGVRAPWPSFPKVLLFALRRPYRQTAAFAWPVRGIPERGVCTQRP
jgi:hypothetical protein